MRLVSEETKYLEKEGLIEPLERLEEDQTKISSILEFLIKYAISPLQRMSIRNIYLYGNRVDGLRQLLKTDSHVLSLFKIWVLVYKL